MCIFSVSLHKFWNMTSALPTTVSFYIPYIVFSLFIPPLNALHSEP